MLHALSAYFGVAICNTGRGRKPQNQYSIRLPTPMDNDKSPIIASYKHCASSPGNEDCKRYANLFGAESGYVLRKRGRDSLSPRVTRIVRIHARRIKILLNYQEDLAFALAIFWSSW